MRQLLILVFAGLPLLAQHIPPGAEDIGAADPSLPLEGVTLQLQPFATQKAELRHLLAAQQDPSSPDFHHWLTPEQFADRFGLGVNDIARVSTWLQGRGFRIESTARGRIWIAFSGTAGQLESAFGARIHRYRLNGRIHYANSNPPTIPVELSAVVSGLRGLDNFPLRPTPRPLYTTSTGQHQLVPDDIATIYDTTPLLRSGINGSGIKIGVPGGSAIQNSDIDSFRAKYNLPANEPQIVLAGAQPGTVSGAFTEADIDIEWAGAIAPSATIVYAYALNVNDAQNYLIDNNLVQVITTSYGSCEAQGSIVDNMIAQQANAQGITWISSSGDTGAAYCDNGSLSTTGDTVAEPASYPEVTAVGGTSFNEGTGTYWSAANGPNLGSALSYIPEVAWNELAQTSAVRASGGGPSVLFPKPLWQNAPGVPADGARDLPDVALAASPDHDGYEVFTAGQLQVYGGTSVSTPVFAGMVALLNQSLVSRGIVSQPGLGNINGTLYTLARTTPGVFHDITQGNNLVACQAGSPDCYGGFAGFYAGPGYDLVTGIGSVDLASLAAQWTIPAALPSNVVASATPNPDYSTKIVLTLAETGGGGTTLTGLTLAGQDYSSQIVSLFGTSYIAAYDTLTSNPITLTAPSLPNTAVFAFSGRDPSGRTWTQQVNLAVLAPLSSSAVTVAGVSNAASGKTVFAQGMIMSVYGTNFTTATQTASSLPLPATMQGVSATVNGVTAPLYFVSPSQVNLQIPYGTTIGVATLVLTSAAGTATFPFTVQANSPGIFASNASLVPYATGKHGDTLLAFITGEGAVSPAITTGATPSPTTPYTQLPAPTGSVAVTVGGVSAPVAFAGIPSGLAGATQINFVIPAGAPTGVQPLVVTIGGTSSPAVLVTVTQ